MAKNCLVHYGAVDQHEGLKIIMVAPKDDFLNPVVTSVLSSIIILFILMALCTIFIIPTVKKVTKPIQSVTTRLELLAEGDVFSPLPEFETSASEMQSLKRSLEITLTNTGSVIKDMDYIITGMASGNFDIIFKSP